jgi:serine/threonine protein kinase
MFALIGGAAAEGIIGGFASDEVKRDFGVVGEFIAWRWSPLIILGVAAVAWYLYWYRIVPARGSPIPAVAGNRAPATGRMLARQDATATPVPSSVPPGFTDVRPFDTSSQSTIVRAVDRSDKRSYLVKRTDPGTLMVPVDKLRQIYQEADLTHRAMLPLRTIETSEGRYEILAIGEGWSVREAMTGTQGTGIDGALLDKWAWDLLEALGPLHRNGYIHQDISPGNVFLAAGTLDAILLDFATVVATDDRTSPIMFTPGFGAPELLGGDRTTASDIYALGALLYHLNTGRLPPTAEDRHNRGAEMRLRGEVSRALSKTVERMVLMDPAERPADAPAVEAYMRSVKTGTEALSLGVSSSLRLPDGSTAISSRHAWAVIPRGASVPDEVRPAWE